MAALRSCMNCTSATSIGTPAAHPPSIRVRTTSSVCESRPGREHCESTGLSGCHPEGSACPEHPAQFWCTVSPFRINTCKSASKQTTLTLFKINTYEKTGGGGAPRSRNTDHGPLSRTFFLFILLRTLLRILALRRNSTPFFSNDSALFAKKHRVWGYVRSSFRSSSTGRGTRITAHTLPGGALSGVN
jgi:hypothetical protein